MRARAAGHGVHPSDSATARPVLILPRIVGSRGGRPSATPAARRPTPSARSVVTPSSAGHGVDRSFSPSPQSPRARRLLAGIAPFAGCSAGHGVHPSFFDGRPALR
jgi:hypothetical protein